MTARDVLSLGNVKPNVIFDKSAFQALSQSERAQCIVTVEENITQSY